MSGGLHLGKGVQDNGYGQFLSMLGYKLEERRKHLIKETVIFASSKTVYVDIRKGTALWIEYMSVNVETGWIGMQDAAVNIREEGKRIYKEYLTAQEKIRNRMKIKQNRGTMRGGTRGDSLF